MFITKKSMSRRTVLQGLGTAVALPMLEAMLPAMTPMQQTAAKPRTRLACIEMVHGSAGAVPEGLEKHMWDPAEEGRNFDLTPSSMLPLEPFRDYLTIISNTDCRAAEATQLAEVGGDHFRTAAVFLTQCHPKQTMGSDVYVGTSVDQLYAQRFGQETPIPSLQLSIESLDQAGGCYYNYACAYIDCISWSSPSQYLPGVRDPRVVFDQLFGSGGTPADQAARRKNTKSVLDWITREVGRLKKDLGPTDRARLNEYLDDVREIERRIQKIEAHNASGEKREFPMAPMGVPDSFEEHMHLMFDLQAVAFSAGITNVSAFKVSRDGTGRVYPESGVNAPFHRASHHGGTGERLAQFAQINKYHVSMMLYFLDKLKNTPDGDGNLLDHTVVMYGSAMGDSNVHNHRRCPLFLAGHGNGLLQGNMHIRAATGTPMANVLLTLLNGLGMTDLSILGDSTGPLAL
jgi:uncharacterized protein DUF1552